MDLPQLFVYRLYMKMNCIRAVKSFIRIWVNQVQELFGCMKCMAGLSV